MPLVQSLAILRNAKNPLVKASVKFKGICEATSSKYNGYGDFDKEWSPYFKRYIQCGLIDKYDVNNLKFFSHCIVNLIKNGDAGLEDTLDYFHEEGVALYKYIGTGIFTASIEILAHLAYDAVEYCLVTEGLSVGETRKKIMELGYPQVSTGLAIMWYLEDENLELD